MKAIKLMVCGLALIAAHASSAATWTYRGELNDGGKPAEGRYRLRLTLMNESTNAAIVGPIMLPEVIVSNGRFAAEVDFALAPNNNQPLLLKTEVAQGDSAFVTLGAPTRFDATAIAAGMCWDTQGNAGTNPLTDFVGTSDNHPLVLRVNNAQALRIVPTLFAPNLIGGAAVNSVSASAAGQTVAGGGESGIGCGAKGIASCSNQTGDFYASVGGGAGNTAFGLYSSINGGDSNSASGQGSSISGGSDNIASGLTSAVNGGSGNIASGVSSVVVGGLGNTASGADSTASGGFANCAGGDYSWTGGRSAKVRVGNEPGDGTCAPGSLDADGDNGTFVWSDSRGSAFVSTGPDQFLVRADAGVMFNANTLPSAGVDLVVGAAHSTGDADTEINLVSRSGNIAFLKQSDSSGHLTIGTVGNGHFIQTNDRFGVIRTPATNALEVEGNASKTTAGSWLANSDRRIKTAIAPIDDALATINRLAPVTFRYSDAYRRAHASIGSERYFNVIAQDFREVFPDAVHGSGEFLPGMAKTKSNEILQVDTYPALITAIAALQELDAKDSLLDERVDRLADDNAQLKARLATLEAQLIKLQAGGDAR